METGEGALALLHGRVRGSSVDLHAGGGRASLQWLSLGGLCCSYVNAIQLGL